jgi:protein-S-isoprenylcysteine O-methyltransferase Ste14
VTGLPVDVGLAVCWGVVGLEWVAGALYNAFHVRGDRTQNLRGQVVVVGMAMVCAVLVVVSRSYLDELTIGAVWVRVLGLVALVASTVFTLWARISLGSMWSLGSTVRNDHQLRTTGPYGVTRHPIYTGLVGMLIGTTLLAGAGQWIVLFPVGLILLELKIHTEERLFLATLPDDYRRYRRQVPQLVPGLFACADAIQPPPSLALPRAAGPGTTSPTPSTPS